MALFKKTSKNKNVAKNTNLSYTANVYYHLLGVLQIVIIFLLVVCVIMLGALITVKIVKPDTVLIGTLNYITFGELNIEITDDIVPNSKLASTYDCIVFSFIIAFLVYFYYIFKIIKNILKPMIEDKPFTPNVSKNIEKLALASIIMATFLNFANWLKIVAINNFFNLEQIIQNDNIKSFSVNYSFDLTFIFISSILIFISFIFKHGEKLQQLSDETV